MENHVVSTFLYSAAFVDNQKHFFPTKVKFVWQHEKLDETSIHILRELPMVWDKIGADSMAAFVSILCRWI